MVNNSLDITEKVVFEDGDELSKLVLEQPGYPVMNVNILYKKYSVMI